MLAHCRQEHPNKPPFGEDPTRRLVMTDNQGRVLSSEEVGWMLDHLPSWYENLGLLHRRP
jgi:hypothetical protein